MRRAIVVLGLALSLVIALTRALDKPLFSSGYEYALTTVFTSTQELFLYTVLLYAVLLALFTFVLRLYVLPVHSALILILTPALIVSLTTPSTVLPLGIIAMLILVFYQQSILLFLLSTALFMIEPVTLILAPVLLFVLFVRKQHALFLTTTITATLLAIFTLPRFTIQAGIAEVGVLGATSMFILLLSTVGIILKWNKTNYPYLLLACLVIAASIFITELLIFGGIAMAITAGYALKALHEREWRMMSIKNASILLVICGLLFSTLITINQGAEAEPDAHAQHMLHFVSHLEQEVFVLSQHHAFFRWNNIQIHQTNEQALLETRDTDRAKHYLPHYVVLHHEDAAENLRFMIAFTPSFDLLYENDRWQVWEVLHD